MPHKKYIYIQILIILFSLIVKNNYAQDADYQIEKGIANIKKGLLDEDIIPLNGDWKFYPGKLLTPKDIKAGKAKNKAKYIKVPSNWNIKEEYKKYKYATYSLDLIHNHKNKGLGIVVKDIATAYKVFVDDSLMLQSGKIATTKKDYEPNFVTQELYFTPKSDTSQIVIQVANYSYAKSGIIVAMTLGSEVRQKLKQKKLNEVRLYLMGALLIMALYNIVIWLLRKNRLSELTFGIFVMMLILRIAVVDHVSTFGIINLLPWSIRIKIEYFTMYAAGLSIFLYTYTLYINIFKKIFFKIYTLISSVFILSLFVLPMYYISATLIGFQIPSLLFIIYVGVKLFKESIKNKEVRIFITGILIFFITVINDLLHTDNIINTEYIMSYGLFVFILIQAYLISKRQIQSYEKIEQLYSEILEINQGLDNKVKERTKMLEEKNKVLEQKEEYIKSGMSYAHRIQKSVMPKVENFHDYFKNYFIINKPQNIVSGDFYHMMKIDNKMFITVADCTGHGIPGGFMSMMGISLLHEVVLKKKLSRASSILDELRERVKTSLQQTGKRYELKDGMDLAMMIFDYKTKEIQYAGANNDLLIITHDLDKDFGERSKEIIRNDEKKLVQLTANRQPIGIYIKEKPFINNKFKFSPTDKYYLLSDGYADQIGGKLHRKFMAKNLKKTIFETSKYTLEAQGKVLEKINEDWMKTATKQTDDILILGFSISDNKKEITNPKLLT